MYVLITVKNLLRVNSGSDIQILWNMNEFEPEVVVFTDGTSISSCIIKMLTVFIKKFSIWSYSNFKFLMFAISFSLKFFHFFYICSLSSHGLLKIYNSHSFALDFLKIF